MKLSRNLVTASPWYILNWLGTSSQSYAYQTRFHVCPAFYLVRTSAPVCNDKNITKAVCKGPDVLRHRLRIRMIAHPPPGMVQTCLSGRFTSIRGIQPRDHWGGHWWNHREQVRCHPFFQHEPACQKVASEKPPVFTALNILHSERSHLQDLLHANMSSQAVAAKAGVLLLRDKGTGPAKRLGAWPLQVRRTAEGVVLKLGWIPNEKAVAGEDLCPRVAKLVCLGCHANIQAII